MPSMQPTRVMGRDKIALMSPRDFRLVLLCVSGSYLYAYSAWLHARVPRALIFEFGQIEISAAFALFSALKC